MVSVPLSIFRVHIGVFENGVYSPNGHLNPLNRENSSTKLMIDSGFLMFFGVPVGTHIFLTTLRPRKTCGAPSRMISGSSAWGQLRRPTTALASSGICSTLLHTKTMAMASWFTWRNSYEWFQLGLKHLLKRISEISEQNVIIYPSTTSPNTISKGVWC